MIPILWAGAALGDARLEAARRTWWRLACGACAAAGAVLVAIGTIQPWTPHKLKGPHASVAAVLSDSPVLVRAERRAAARMNRAGRHLKALDLARHALRPRSSCRLRNASGSSGRRTSCPPSEIGTPLSHRSR